MGLDNPIHLALLLMILLLVFGAKRLPEMGRSLGDGLRGFKEAVNPDSSDAHSHVAAITHEPTTPVVHDSVPTATVVENQPEEDLVH